MRVITWAHLLYIGFWSIIALALSVVGPVKGFAISSTSAGIHAVLHLALACVGIGAVLLAVRNNHAFTWLLVLWWLPQLVQVTVATRAPTYPQNLMTPIYMVTAGPHVSVALVRELGIDKLLLVRLSLIAVAGIILAFVAIAQQFLSRMLENANAEPDPPADPDEPPC